MTVSSPCVGRCALDPASGLCRGCGRTGTEIARWSELSEAERRAVMAALPARLYPESDGSLTIVQLDARNADP